MMRPHLRWRMVAATLALTLLLVVPAVSAEAPFRLVVPGSEQEGQVPAIVAPGAAPEQNRSETEVIVRMRGNIFSSGYLFIPLGTTVSWINEEADPTNAHNVLAEDGSFASPHIWPGESWSYTFTRPGYFRYFCELHEDMEGAVLVAEE